MKSRRPSTVHILAAAWLGGCLQLAACSSTNEPGDPASPSAGAGGGDGAQATGGQPGRGGASGTGGQAAGGNGGAPGSGGTAAGTGGRGGGGVDLASADRAGETGGVAGKAILMIVGRSNGTTGLGQSFGDKYIRARLETRFGHRITLGDDTSPAGSLAAAAASVDAVLVTESVSSANLGAKVKALGKPLLNYEAFIQDEMGFSQAGMPGDPGLPDRFAIGVKDQETQIEIIDPAHPLAAGLIGLVAVYKTPKQVTWGKVGPAAKVVATLPGDVRGASIYTYARGAMLPDGTTAAGLRVNIFLEDDDVDGTPNMMTDEGHRLFDAAIIFTLDPASSK